MLRTRRLAIAAPLAALFFTGIARADEATPPAMSMQLAPLPPGQATPQPQVVIIQQAAPAPAPVPVYVQQVTPPYYFQQGGTGVIPLRPRVIRDWDESQPIPLGYHQEEHVRTGLVIGGAVTFGSMYLLTALGASIANDGGASEGALFIPGLGPFVQMTKTSSSTAAFWLALDGVVQLGGVAMFVAGLALPRTELVRNDTGFELHLAPLVAKDQTGVGVVGRF